MCDILNILTQRADCGTSGPCPIKPVGRDARFFLTANQYAAELDETQTATPARVARGVFLILSTRGDSSALS